MATLPSAENIRKLRQAMADQTLVQVSTCFEDMKVTGYVLDVGPGFFLLAVVNDRIWYEGFEAFRLPDVTQVEPARGAIFIEAALEKRGENRPARPDVSLSDIETLVRSANAAFPLVTLHTEMEDAEVCWIGRVLDIADSEISLLEISPSAVWDDAPTPYRLADITRVGMGADYEDALYLVGGEPRG
jgi:hypothetical protein